MRNAAKVCIGVAMLATMVSAVAQEPEAKPVAFEVASVKTSTDCSHTTISQPGEARLQLTNVSMNFLVSFAFNTRQYQLENLPNWANASCYTVSAVSPAGSQLDYDHVRLRLQQLMMERFKLAVHHEKKEIAGYALVVAKDGPKLQASQRSTPGPGSIMPDGLRAQGWPMENFTAILTNPVHRPIVDKTGLNGRYDIKLNYAPENASDSTLPSIFTALQEQLGLKLEPQQVPLDIVVIDHLEKVPAED